MTDDELTAIEQNAQCLQNAGCGWLIYAKEAPVTILDLVVEVRRLQTLCAELVGEEGMCNDID